MSVQEGVTVLLPVSKVETGLLERAFTCVQKQTHERLEILLVLNGADEPTRACAQRLCGGDERAWMIEIERAQLAGALNVGLSEARYELVARMDADDACDLERVERQVEAMRARPAVAALGTGYRVVGPGGGNLGVVTPPADPDEARWRLLISNPFAHGSMMLRRSAVLAVGGYDETFDRAQDYELWSRLSMRGRRSGVCALPQVLYTLTRAEESRAFGATPMQGAHAARVMARAWDALPRGRAAPVLDAIASMAERGHVEPARRQIEEHMRAEGASMVDLLAWLWGSWTSPGSHLRAFDAARAARVREVGRELRGAGVSAVWVWGAGRHTDWLLSHADDLGVPVVGIVDDELAGQERFGYRVESPAAISAGEHVLLSSDWHEEAMWASSQAHRQRGVRVWRIYCKVGEPGEGEGRSAA
ncbi:MAG: glycosyltransferase [Leptolyngbya sp. PLA3]|nr:MAG: glycosyltransferase [Cyanobacteria bacterium CYA]MCE7967724.1 glycosyltransferase [Leptolyngbya sp. PL-A3]